MLPERLWQAARELGIHVTIDSHHDEAYRRLKAEEHRLQQRLHHLRVDDRDRSWWTVERQRLVARLQEIPSANGSSVVTGNARSTTALHAEQSELQRREYEINQQIRALRNRIAQLPPIAYENNTSGDYFVAGSQTFSDATSAESKRSTRSYRDSFGVWDGYHVRNRSATVQATTPELFSRPASQVESDQNAIVAQLTKLETEQRAIQSRLNEILRLIDQRDVTVSNVSRLNVNKANAVWEQEELHSRIAYADEVLKCWDLYEQTRQRLAEVQAQLRGHGPYHEATKGSFLQTVERYIRELSAGSLRQLPTWALEALRRDLGYVAGLSAHGRSESYREVYRDYRPDLRRHDHRYHLHSPPNVNWWNLRFAWPSLNRLRIE